MFLLTVIPALSSAFSAIDPVSPSGVTSHSIRWLSVPPVASFTPPVNSVSASTRAFATICRAYTLNAGSAASRKQTAFAATMCSSGPPCIPGKTDLSIALACASRHRMNPARGPRSVLCDVLVTKSATGTGLLCTPAATSPE